MYISQRILTDLEQLYEHKGTLEIAEDLSTGGTRATYEYPPNILTPSPHFATPYTSPHSPLATPFTSHIAFRHLGKINTPPC
jgi:hypothetical protein